MVATSPKLISELIVDFLVEKKITHVFDLTGGMITYLEDAISRKKGIVCVPMHHEQAAGFAAEGYSRKGQNFGVALATSGPGATNLVTAIGSCYFDSVPALFITGQVHTNNIKKHESVRQEGFQETDIVEMVKGITKYAVQVRNPEDVLYELEKAFYYMNSGRKGSVLLDIPINIQRSLCTPKTMRRFIDSKEYTNLCKELYQETEKNFAAKLKKLQELLNNSQAPIILAGNGVRLSGGSDLFMSFLKKTKIPFVTSLMGLDAHPHTSSSFVGYIGTNGNRDANMIFSTADLLIVLGSRLDVRQIGDPSLFNKKTKIVHVDVDVHAIDYMLATELSFVADVKTFLKVANTTLRVSEKKKWKSFITNIQNSFGRKDAAVKDINPNIFITALSSVTPEKATIVVDVGQNQMWTAQSWIVKQSQRLLFSGGMGAMGFSLPAAIGSWFAYPKDELLVISGDGGLQINIQELETVVRNKIPLKLFILNNGSLGMVREFQDLYFNKNYQSSVTGYGFPNFKKLAAAYGLTYYHIKSHKDSKPILSKVFQQKGPVFVEVSVPFSASLSPRVVFGKSLDDQAPYLNEEQKELFLTYQKTLYE